MDSCQDGDIWLFYQSNLVAQLITQIVLVLVVVGLCDADVHEFEGVVFAPSLFMPGDSHIG